MYDAEDRIVGVDGGTATYLYDAFGKPIEKTVSGVKTDYIYDLAGREVSRMGGTTGNWMASEVYAGGAHIATYNNGTTYFSHLDLLGSERSRTDISATVIETCRNLSYGDTATSGALDCSFPYARNADRC